MVHRSDLPPGSLLDRYAASGAFTDCYVTDLPDRVTHAQFVEAFYTTALFRLERRVLAAVARRPSTDAQARQLAQGQLSSFAAWSVESRAADQLLLAAGRTRSWLMVGAGTGAAPSGTRLYFGSAVVPRRSSDGTRGGMGWAFGAMLGLHALYSRALLSAARARLLRRAARAPSGPEPGR